MPFRLVGSASVAPQVFGTMKRDRSLLPFFGREPSSVRDTRTHATMWAIDTWPVISTFVFDGTDLGMWPVQNDAVWVEDIEWSGGGDRVYRISGVTRDSVGAIVAGASLDLYRTLDDVLVASTVSNSNGSFSFGVDDATTPHYIRAWKLAPAIQGTSIDTLVGSA